MKKLASAFAAIAAFFTIVPLGYAAEPNPILGIWTTKHGDCRSDLYVYKPESLILRSRQYLMFTKEQEIKGVTYEVSGSVITIAQKSIVHDPSGTNKGPLMTSERVTKAWLEGDRLMDIHMLYRLWDSDQRLVEDFEWWRDLELKIRSRLRIFLEGKWTEGDNIDQHPLRTLYRCYS
jgi:hypothetical protein